MLFRGQQSFSTLPPKIRDHFTFDTPPGDNNFNPVNLAYRALEFRGEEKDRATKSPLIVHHSLYGRKENWNPISDVSFFKNFFLTKHFIFIFPPNEMMKLKEISREKCFGESILIEPICCKKQKKKVPD